MTDLSTNLANSHIKAVIDNEHHFMGRLSVWSDRSKTTQTMINLYRNWVIEMAVQWQTFKWQIMHHDAPYFIILLCLICQTILPIGPKKIPVVPVSYREKITVGRSEIQFFLNFFFHGFGGFLLGDLQLSPDINII
jgi:hypothetical protein